VAEACLRLPVRCTCMRADTHRQAQRRNNASQKLSAFVPLTLKLSLLGITVDLLVRCIFFKYVKTMGNKKECNLRSALFFIGDKELIPDLAKVLLYAHSVHSVLYQKIGELIGGNAAEVILLSDEWRLLLPIRTKKSSDWEDRLLLLKDNELFGMPNVVRYLVRYSLDTGKWDIRNAVLEFFKDLKDPNFNQMPDLLRSIIKRSRNNSIGANQIKKACMELSLINRVDSLIAELKAAGFMSPKLGPLVEASMLGVPLYELNPSLFPPEINA